MREAYASLSVEMHFYPAAPKYERRFSPYLHRVSVIRHFAPALDRLAKSPNPTDFVCDAGRVVCGSCVFFFPTSFPHYAVHRGPTGAQMGDGPLQANRPR